MLTEQVGVAIADGQLGVPAASLRKFTLVYCTQDEPLSSAVRVAAQRTPTPRSLAEECSCRKHEESTACKGPFNLPGSSRPRSATDPLARSRVHTLRFFLIRETVGTVRDHVRVHERRYTSKVLIGDRVARRPQLVHNFRNPQRVPHQHRI